MSSGGAAAALERVPLRVLIVEDSVEDADLMVLELRRGGYNPVVRRVDTPDAMRAALNETQWDLVLCDYSMPRFTLPAALAMIRERGLDIPFVIVSATIGEEAAVEAMKAGAHDYILKHRLGRLVPAVRRELQESDVRRERRILEEQLRHAQKLESIGLLAGGIAHDFNNLLTGIMGNASLLLDSLILSDSERIMLDDVIRATEQAAILTRQLLAYAGKGKFVIELVGLSELVQDIGHLIRSSIPRTAEVILDLDRNLPPVEADPSQMQQLVMNLVINAAEAIGEERGRVRIRTALRTLGTASYVCLEVRDSGCGMDAATQGQIFDPFFTTKFTGRGLGLSAVQGIVRGHKGFIEVESASGAGSTFTVLLPPAPPAMRNNAAGEPETEALWGSGTILIADDEPLVRRTARVALERYGYRVHLAQNGSEAVDLFRSLKDDLAAVVLDLTMPVMGGEEAYREMHRIRADIPVIISSGYDELEAMRRFAGQGAAGFLKKPYTARKLAEKLKSTLAP